MRVQFRAKVFLAVFGVAGVIVLAASVLFSLWLGRQTNDRIQRTLISEVRLIADLLSQVPKAAPPEQIAEEAERAGRHLGARVTLIAADGRVVGDSSVPRRDLATLENHNDRPEVSDARRTGLGTAQRHSHTLGEDLLYVAVPVEHPAITIARVALPLTEVRQQLNAVRHLTLAALAVALVSALGLALLTSALLTRRVRAIADAARQYATGDVMPVPQAYQDDELGTVASVLDETVRKLRERVAELGGADQVRRDFVANVSHELRTPLTAIRGYVEALDDDPLDPADRRRFLEIVARHTARMERLVKDLLRLARLEARQEPIEAGWHSVDATIRGAVGDLSSAIETKRQQVEVQVDPAVGAILTDGAKLQDALRNIVENAVAYAPADTVIEVRAAVQADRIAITVADQGPGIPPGDLTRIFERFYRVDKARSRESGGTGLGLSIVKHLVERLSGEVWAANRPEGGAIFTILVPHGMAATQGSTSA